MIAEAAKRRSEAQSMKSLGVQHWIDDLPWLQANERLESQPTVNIEGLVGGYTGPGGKTILPHRAVTKIDMRLVPDMKFADAAAALKAHLAKHGFGDVEVNVTGGYDPTATVASAPLIQAQVAVLKRAGGHRLALQRGIHPGPIQVCDEVHVRPRRSLERADGFGHLLWRAEEDPLTQRCVLLRGHRRWRGRRPPARRF